MIRFEHRTLHGFGPTDKALLIIPERDLRVGRERLEAVGPPQASTVDDSIAAAAKVPGSTVHVSVFCGRAPGQGGSWGFADDLNAEEAYELAQLLVRSQILTLRRLFLAGVCMHVRIDMGGREQIAFRRAADTVRKALESDIAELHGARRELAELDVWLLRNFVFFFAVSVDRLLESTLGANAHSVKQRIRRAERRRSGLSAAVRGLAA